LGSREGSLRILAYLLPSVHNSHRQPFWPSVKELLHRYHSILYDSLTSGRMMRCAEYIRKMIHPAQKITSDTPALHETFLSFLFFLLLVFLFFIFYFFLSLFSANSHVDGLRFLRYDQSVFNNCTISSSPPGRILVTNGEPMLELDRRDLGN
jgi:hypothetical protein